MTYISHLMLKLLLIKLSKKANSRLKFLQRKGRYLNVYTKKLLVSALIQCHYDYACSSCYLGLTKQTKQRLQITQNKIIKIVLNLSPRSHIGANEFQELRVVEWVALIRFLFGMCHYSSTLDFAF